MLKSTLAATAVLGLVGLSLPAIAENLTHLNQLLSTKACQFCDLSNSGLVMADLSGAQLSGANLVGANLSQANLTGADLSGANLSGASLHGANLTGANLRGAILNGTDLRNSYLYNVDVSNTNLDAAYMQGAIGIPTNAGTSELFYGWGLLETKKGNYQASLNHYNKALSLDPDFAPAYLARAFTLLRLGNEQGAIQNAEIAAKLFEEQNDTQGQNVSQSFIAQIEAFQEARNQGQQNGQMDNIIRGVASLVLRFLL